MTDMRKQQERRRGEKNGPFSWWHLFDALVILLVVLAIAYTSFMLGRHYEAVAQKDKDAVDQATLYKEYKSYRVKSHP